MSENNKVKEERIFVRVTSKEKSRMTRAAAKKNLTLSEYIRLKALDRPKAYRRKKEKLKIN